MEKAELSNNSQKEPGEKPHSQEKTDVVHEASVLRGTNLLPSGKCEKVQAFPRKPDVKEEIMILLCILKKTLKVISCHGQRQSCATAALAIEKCFMQMETSLDDFKRKFIRIYCGQNNICCYAKLLSNLMDTRCQFINETNRVHCVYKAKVDIINCAIAAFRTLENKVCTIMARVNETGNCEQSCRTEVNNGLLGTCRPIRIEDDKSEMMKAIENVACCGCPKEKSICVITPKNNKCEPESKLVCLKPQVCSVGINAEKPEPSPPFNMTLDYVRYKTDYDFSSDDESDYYVQTLPSGYLKSKIVSKNGTINLSVKCVSHDEDLCLLNPNETGNIEQLKKIAEEMVPIFNMSKAWLNNGKEFCQKILDKRLK